MKLDHIDLGKLQVAALNMRHGKKPPRIDDLLPLIRARGILVPLIVRAMADGEGFEIVAGRRRYHAACALATETGHADPVPCAIIEAGDDAAALEASLIENFAREAPHETALWASFTRLIKQGRTPDELAATFGFSARHVTQILALGNLLPKIRDLYASDQLDIASVRFLTLASKSQQRDWLALAVDPKASAPTGHALRQWLFGGQAITTNVALFDLASYTGAIVADLFGEGGFFADSGQFWDAQRAEVERRRRAYLEAGWAEVVVLEPGQHFHSWDYEHVAKAKGGKVYIALTARGEVAFHEGYLTRAAARKAQAGQGDAEVKPVRPELSARANAYVDLHRHAAVRAALVDQPGVALRLLAAHALGGSGLVQFRAQTLGTGGEAVAESVELGAADRTFDTARSALLARLGLGSEAAALVASGAWSDTTGLFVRLLAWSDEAVVALLTLVMAECIEAGSPVVEAVGAHLALDMTAHYRADDTLFELVRDREVLLAMVGDMAGTDVAAQHAKESGKVLKTILRDCLAGENGRAKVERWCPRWMAFPPCAYTDRGGVGAVSAAEQAALAIANPVSADPVSVLPQSGEAGTVDIEPGGDETPQRLAA